MCGIAGIFGTEREDRLAESVAAMQRALVHRGPDDAGLWRSASCGTTLAHTRLSIIDLSAAGHQPMMLADGRLTIVFNGEIYNYRALRADLEAAGVTFRTHTDTEVLLRLYERHGESCLTKLRGMFAFAIWDEDGRRGFMARDRFGIKPLYWAERNGVLVFASEIRALLASGLIPRELDAGATMRYFETGSVPEPLTLVRGVNLLGAGCSLAWNDGTAKNSRWWQIRFSDDPVSPEDATRRTRAALLDSVEHHFVSDVPVGIFLSGGIDSTALLAMAKATGRENVRTFSIGVDDAALDESSAARRTAEHFRTQHEEARLDAVRGRELFTRFLGALDQPSIDGFNTYCVSALAREHGMKVVLSGLGGDEMFAGYPSFARLPKLLRQTRLLGPLRKPAGLILQRFTGRPPLRRLGSALRGDAGLRSLYKAFRGIFPADDARTLAAQLTGKSPGEPMADTPTPPAQPTVADDISALELTHYMRNQLLKDSDVMSMAHGLELRVPLVDAGLFDAVAAIPASLRLRQGKKLLLDAVPEIPEWIAQAPKRGFLFPYQRWLDSDEWKPSFAAALKGLPVAAPNWYQRWSVFVFRQFLQTNGVSSAIN